jgi:hypothetical protein
MSPVNSLGPAYVAHCGSLWRVGGMLCTGNIRRRTCPHSHQMSLLDPLGPGSAATAAASSDAVHALTPHPPPQPPASSLLTVMIQTSSSCIKVLTKHCHCQQRTFCSLVRTQRPDRARTFLSTRAAATSVSFAVSARSALAGSIPRTD